MPTEQITTYFHVASNAVRVRRWPTRKAVTTVVASIATHTTPMLLAHTANTIAARNAGVSTPYRRAPSASVWPSASSVSMYPMLAQVASVPTTPMTMSMVTESASIRSSPPSAMCPP